MKIPVQFLSKSDSKKKPKKKGFKVNSLKANSKKVVDDNDGDEE